MACLTTWERNQIEIIDKLLEKAQLRYIAFEREHRLLNENMPGNEATPLDETLVSQRLRYFAFDLYAVLDYLCFLCYCHFQNNGQPDYTSKSRNIKFPSNEKLRKSNNAQSNEEFGKKHDQFARNQFEIIFGSLDDESMKTRFEKFKPFILRCQSFILDNHAREMTGEAKEFNLLRFIRNYSAHRDLLRVSVQNAWLNINSTTGVYEISTEESDDENVQSIEAAPGCWLLVPEYATASEQMTPRQLLIIAVEIKRFAVNTRNEILNIAFGDTVPQFDMDKRNIKHALHALDTCIGVCIGKERFTWGQFDEICHRNKNISLWAV